MPPPPQTLRREVITIYKALVRPHLLPPRTPCHRDQQGKRQLYLGRDYPLGYKYFQPRLHAAFMSQAHLRDEPAIRRGIERAEFVKKEIEALYRLKKYRAMRQRYELP